MRISDKEIFEIQIGMEILNYHDEYMRWPIQDSSGKHRDESMMIRGK